MSTKIIASTKEEFEKLEKSLNELPSLVKSNVEIVEQTFHYPRFTFYQKFDVKTKIYVPENISFVSLVDDVIEICCENKGWFSYPYKTKNYEIIQQ